MSRSSILVSLKKVTKNAVNSFIIVEVAHGMIPLRSYTRYEHVAIIKSAGYIGGVLETFRITQLIGRPGSGKTAKLIADMIALPARYIYALPRLDLMRECAAAILERAGQACPVLRVIDSQDCLGGVTRAIYDAVAETREGEHVIIIISHAALIMIDIDRFPSIGSWHVRVDEIVDNAVLTGALYGPVAHLAFARLFDLEPIDDTVSRLRAKFDLSLGAIMRDPLFTDFANLWRRAQTPSGVILEARSWDDVARHPCGYVSVWSPRSLAPFQTVTIAAAGLDNSLMSVIDSDIAYDRVDLPRDSARATVDIRYFCADHRASSVFWGSETGRINLGLIGAHLAEQAVGYWAANDTALPSLRGRIPGDLIRPRAEGTNAYRHHTSCAIFFSSKRLPADATLERYFKITPAQIEVAREHEAIVQFVFRGAIRDRDYAGRYTIWIYDRSQAARLSAHLATLGFATTTEHVDLPGFRGRPTARTPGRPPTLRTPAEKAAARIFKIDADWERMLRRRHPEYDDAMIARLREHRVKRRAEVP